jgi:hypothetical protein
MELLAEVNAAGETLRRAWDAQGFRPAAFGALAAGTLAELVRGGVDLPRILAAMPHCARTIPQLASPAAASVTLFDDARFSLTAHVWILGASEIHDHGFHGAFTLVEGALLHSRYRFHPDAPGPLCDAAPLALGELVGAGHERLVPGVVRTLAPGDVHAVTPISTPSVVLGLRTSRAAPAHRFLRSGLAYLPGEPDAPTRKALEELEVLRTLKHPGLMGRAIELAEAATPWSAFQILRRLARLVSERDLAERLAELPRRLEAIAARVHAELAHARRARHCDYLRQQALGPELRLLVTLLHRVEEREELLALLAEALPGLPAGERLVRGLEHLAERAPAAVPSLLGFELDEATRSILAELVAGGSDGDVVARLADTYADVATQRSDLLDLCAALRATPLLSAILARA